MMQLMQGESECQEDNSTIERTYVSTEHLQVALGRPADPRYMVETTLKKCWARRESAALA